MPRKLSLAYAAGSLAALAACLLLWLLGREGVTGWLSVSLPWGLDIYRLYPRLIFGGLCGLLLVLPLASGQLYLQALLMALAPAAYILLVYFPRAGRGLLGVAYGPLTPLLVGLLCLLWGFAAVAWYRLVRG